MDNSITPSEIEYDITESRINDRNLANHTISEIPLNKPGELFL